jgi:hypothetical protein
MKTLITMLAVGLMLTAANAQNTKEKDKNEKGLKESAVPAAVKAAMQKMYPGITVKKWDKEGKSYEADFAAGGVEQSVLLDATGNVKETERAIPVDQLPAPAREYIARNYKGATIREAAMISDAAGVVTYEAEVKGKDVLFNAAGKFIKTAKE